MFSKKPAATLRARSNNERAMTPRNGNSTFSVLGTDISVHGNITASADLHVDGNVEGDIACSALVQGEGSTINGGVTAETAFLLAKVLGTTPEFWLNLQYMNDMWLAMHKESLAKKVAAAKSLVAA